MNKTELIAAVAQKSDLTKKDAEKAVKAVFEAISDSLTQGDKVQIIGFGTFEVRQRKGRMKNGPFLFIQVIVLYSGRCNEGCL